MQKSPLEKSARHARFRAMRRRATALLVVVALLYVAAAILRGAYPWLAYVAAAAEAGIIGAVADWFAVVALFHHPLNLKILPHTNVIPRNKGRIAEQLGEFIQREFVSPELIAERISDFNPGLQLSMWVANPANANQVAAQATTFVSYALNAFDDRRITHFLHEAITAKAREVDFMVAAARLLEVLTHSNRHHLVLTELLGILDELLKGERTRLFITEELTRQIWALRILERMQVHANEKAARKMIDIALNVISEVRNDPNHELRQRFDELMRALIERLQRDEVLRGRLQQLMQDVLESAPLRAYVEELWLQLRAWLQSDLAADTSLVQANLAGTLQLLGMQLHADAGARQWINDQVIALVPPFIHRHRMKIGRFVETQVNAWTTEKLVSELEQAIGADLQYIRINGTVVGAAVGLAIYAVTRLFA